MASGLLTPLRDVHHKRIADLTLAYLREKLPTQEALVKAHSNFLSSMQSADKKFRDIIDQNCPLMYVIDCEEIATIIYNELRDTVKENSKTLKDYTFTYKEGGKATKYFSAIENYDEAGEVESSTFNTDKQFYETFMSKVLNNTFIDTVTKSLKNTLDTAITATVDPNLLNSTATKLYKDYMSDAAVLNQAGSKYVNYAELSVNYGARFKKEIFATNRAIRLSTPKTVLPNINQNTTVVVLADSFTYFREVYNPKLTDALKQVFKTRGAVAVESKGDRGKPNFSIGEFVDIGHTAAFVTDGQPLGVNMPAAQAAFTDLDIYKGQALETALSELYADLGLQVTFDKQFSSTGTSFINFGVAVGTVMRKPVNSTLLRTVENRVIAPFKTETKKAVIAILSSQEYKDFIIASMPQVQSSKTLIQYITAAIVSPLRTGKILKDEKSTSKVSRKNTSKIAPALKIGKAIKSKLKNAKVSTKTSLATQKLPQRQSTAVLAPNILLSLQNLLNAGLVARVKQNMGTGGRRDILNLRSGRFAESVQVERLSESRSGAITAFYSYMRNPYSTFSTGGAQQNPRSRDPKLLISKSIRELAQTITQQRLRAVLV